MSRRIKNLRAVHVMVSILFMLVAGQVLAYEWFYDPASGSAETGNCRDCHSSFSGRGDLHKMHVGSSNFTGTCQACHFASNGDNPRISKVGDPDPGQYGCMGCHGGDYGKRSGTDIVMEGYGLRQRHVVQNGVTECLDCHDLSVEGLPEDVDPPSYALGGLSNMVPGDSCNPDPFREDGDESWKLLDPEPEAEGIDIDGDGLYDMADPDCDRSVNQGMPPRAINLRWSNASTLDWTILPVSDYEVLRGDMAELTNDRDLSRAGCASSGLTTNQFIDGTIPAPGSALYYVVRSMNMGVLGTAESEGRGQAGGQRDTSLPPSACP